MRGGGIKGHKFFSEICSLANLFHAWKEFKQGKLKKQDISRLAVSIEDHIFDLHQTLITRIYRHGTYYSFYICDPKRRHIHKPTVIDRVLHHAIFRVLEPVFDKTFIFDSYSSRKGKGTHKACLRFKELAWKLSRNNTRQVWVLKCDIKKFFDSIDHRVLLSILRKKIKDEETLGLLEQIINSFETKPGKGIPLGNLTSQLFSNVYLNELDQYIKRTLQVKNYIRYADDFVLLDTDPQVLKNHLRNLAVFLDKELLLSLHVRKVSISRFSKGVDFLGYVTFPYHKILRTKTKKRMLKRIKKLTLEHRKGLIELKSFNQSMSSYLGTLKHCFGHTIRKQLLGIVENHRTNQDGLRE